MSSAGIFIVGYGSLIWRPGFLGEMSEWSKPAWILGYERAWTQLSRDHRGVPDAPGRVVTLMEKVNAKTLAILFYVPKHNVEKVLSYLDYREKGGYSLVERQVYIDERPKKTVPNDEELLLLPSVKGLLYLAAENNEDWGGHCDIEDLAAQIANAVGPSGPNHEYLIRMAEALLAIGGVECFTHDQQTWQLYVHVKRLISPDAPSVLVATEPYAAADKSPCTACTTSQQNVQATALLRN